MILYDMLKKHTLCSIQKMLTSKGKTPYEPDVKSMLYVVANCLPYHINGYTLRTHALLKALSQNDINVHAITSCGYPWDCKTAMGRPNALTTQYENINYQHSDKPRKYLRIIPFVQKAAEVIATYAIQHKVSCIHAASNYVNALPALIAARRLGITFQYEMRGLWELSRAAQRPFYPYGYGYTLGIFFESFVAQQADRVFCISKALANFVNVPIDANKVHILPNCVNVEEFSCAQKPAPQPTHIGYAGALVHYEGLDILLYALQKVKQTQKNVFLHIIGDGKAKKKLEKLAKKLNLQQHVHFYGKLSPQATKQHLSNCILLCIPRRAQDVCKIIPPIKLPEAMALGKAVVVPDLPVFREETQNVPVHYFEAENINHLAKVLEYALQDTKELIRRGQVCQNFVVEFRQWKHFVQNIMPSRNNI